MSRFILAASLLAFIASSAVAQTSDEYGKLRELLNVPPTTVILSSSPSKLPAAAALKVYVATGKDEKAHEHFARLIDKFNQSEGPQLKLEVVVDLEQADVVIARYKGDRVTEERTTETILPPNDSSRAPTSNAPAMIRRPVVYRPLFAYLLVRTPTALEVAYRHVDKSLNEEDPDGKLFSELKKKMKHR